MTKMVFAFGEAAAWYGVLVFVLLMFAGIVLVGFGKGLHEADAFVRERGVLGGLSECEEGVGSVVCAESFPLVVVGTMMSPYVFVPFMLAGLCTGAAEWCQNKRGRAEGEAQETS